MHSALLESSHSCISNILLCFVQNVKLYLLFQNTNFNLLDFSLKSCLSSEVNRILLIKSDKNWWSNFISILFKKLFHHYFLGSYLLYFWWWISQTPSKDHKKCAEDLQHTKKKYIVKNNNSVILYHTHITTHFIL